MISPLQPHSLLPTTFVSDIDSLRKQWGIKGASIAVVKREEGDAFDQWKTDFLTLGVRDGQGNPVNERTLFSIASNSKLFTSIAVGIALEDRRQANAGSKSSNWHTKVKDLVPGWGLQDPIATERADVMDLLTHQTGLPLHTHFEEHDPSITKHESIERLRHLKPSSEFRKRFQYCNAGFLVASAIPEQLSGIPFTQFVEEKIFAPLGMRDTMYDPAWARRTGRRADGFLRTRNEAGEATSDHLNIGWFTTSKDTFAGMGGIITSASDMAIWLKTLLLNGHSPKTNEVVIPASIIKDTMTPRVVVPEQECILPKYLSTMTYGFGQFICTYRGYRLLRYFGNVPGQQSLILRIPTNGLGISIMVNDHERGETFAEAVGYTIIDRLLGLQPEDWGTRLEVEASYDPTSESAPQSGGGSIMSSAALEGIQGTYHDAAYGRLAICAVPSTMPTGFEALKMPFDCTATLSANPFVLAPGSPPTFIARIDKHWSNYLMFQHVRGSTFDVIPNAFYPEHSVNTTRVFGKSRATFTEDGMAWNGDMWGVWPSVAETSSPTEDLKVDAEVWFGKVAEVTFDSSE